METDSKFWKNARHFMKIPWNEGDRTPGTCGLAVFANIVGYRFGRAFGQNLALTNSLYWVMLGGGPLKGKGSEEHEASGEPKFVAQTPHLGLRFVRSPTRNAGRWEIDEQS